MTNTYNTRRKSLSLEALGVQIPGLGRAHPRRGSVDSKPDAAPQQPSKAESRTHDAPEASSSPPAKRIKRSHSPATAAAPPSPASRRPGSSSSAQPKAAAAPSPKAQQQAPQQAPQKPPSRHLEYTPPPSPHTDDGQRIDYESIADDIVEGVVRQLEKTGNRPHLIKELAAVLSTTHDAVTSSANAPALLSSRLANYMKRPCWNSANTCPVGKELIPIHPRKVFYYLTDRERQVLPDTSDDIYGPLGITSPSRVTPPAATPTTAGVGVMGPPTTVPAKRAFAPALLTGIGYNVSPPLSNASVAEDDVDASSVYERGRFAMSPSPEVDLSIHNIDYEHGEEEQAMNSQVVHSAVDNIKHDFPTPPAETASQSSFTSARGSIGGSTERTDAGTRTPMSTRHQSIPLEGDEHEFMGTARQFRERGSGTSTPIETTMAAQKPAGLKDQEHKEDLFAQQQQKEHVMSSPAFQPLPESKHQAKSSVGDMTTVDLELEIGEGFYRWEQEALGDIRVDDLDLLLA